MPEAERLGVGGDLAEEKREDRQQPSSDDVGEAMAREEADVGALKGALEEEREKADRYLANWQRAEADLVNFKRRAEQERADLASYANSTLILELLPVLDDLERALCNVPEDLAEAGWVDGIRLIQRKLKSVLEAQGLSEIECMGEEFDPRFHEAVMCVKGEEGKVVEELQKGYKFKDRVLRPSMCKVGKSDSEI